MHLGVAARALTRPNRTPASRAAWVAVIMLLPLVGVVAYFLLGETSIGRGRAQRLSETLKRLPPPPAPAAHPPSSQASALLCRPASLKLPSFFGLQSTGPQCSHRRSRARVSAT